MGFRHICVFFEFFTLRSVFQKVFFFHSKFFIPFFTYFLLYYETKIKIHQWLKCIRFHTDTKTGTSHIVTCIAVLHVLDIIRFLNSCHTRWSVDYIIIFFSFRMITLFRRCAWPYQCQNKKKNELFKANFFFVQFC